MNVEQRMEIERQIVRHICEHALNSGFALYYSTSPPVNYKEMTLDQVMAEVHSTDEAWLTIYGYAGHITTFFLVYGNDGYDLIGDYAWDPAVGKGFMEEFMDPITAWIDELEEKGSAK